jgi:hypothetical protein
VNNRKKLIKLNNALRLLNELKINNINDKHSAPNEEFFLIYNSIEFINKLINNIIQNELKIKEIYSQY